MGLVSQMVKAMVASSSPVGGSGTLHVLFGKHYFWDRHGKYHSIPQKVIVKIQDQWYDIPKHQPTPIIEMDLAKKAKNLIKHAQKVMLLMVKPQHSQNITTFSRISTDHDSRQQQKFKKVLKEY